MTSDLGKNSASPQVIVPLPREVGRWISCSVYKPERLLHNDLSQSSINAHQSSPAHRMPASTFIPWLLRPAQGRSISLIVGSSVAATLAVITMAEIAFRPRRAKTIPSPRVTQLPKLSRTDIGKLPYPPDIFPGARDVSSPVNTPLFFDNTPELILMSVWNVESLRMGPPLVRRLDDLGVSDCLFKEESERRRRLMSKQAFFGNLHICS